MLLRINIVLRHLKESTVVVGFAHLFKNLERHLSAPQYRAGPFPDAQGIANAVAAPAEHLPALYQQCVIRHQARAYVNRIYAPYDLLGARHRLKVPALCNHRPGDAVSPFVGDRLDEHVRQDDRYTQPPHPVGLHREAPLMRHCLDYRPYAGPRLHELVGGEVTYVARTDGKHVPSQQRELGVHHLLHHGSGVHPGKVVIAEGRHERHRAGGHHQVLRIDVADLA